MFQIKHRFSGSVMFECELPVDIAELSHARQLGYAIKEAVKADAYLARANLARADLADANLADANLAGADLAGADLADADLADANLADANLADANLAGAYLAGADLARANLARADLAGANLADANLAGANLADAKNVPETNGSESIQSGEPYVRATKPEHYIKRAERYRARHPEVPIIPALDAKILDVIESGKGKLRMSSWHSCETTHCRAGWAITLAGEAGHKLETKFGPAVAGRMIYSASTGRVPHFYASDEAAMEDIRARAAEQVAA